MSQESVASVEPVPTRVRGRRSALFGVCVAFLGGAGFGAVSGFFVGRAEEARAEGSGEELAQLRWLATEASEDELVAQAWGFLLQVNCNYREDEVLWRGVDRLVHALPARAADKETRRIARFAEQVIQGAQEGRPNEAAVLLRVLGGVQ